MNLAKRKNFKFTNKYLGGALIVGLLIQFVFPAIMLGSIAWLSTAIYLVVAVILLFFK